MDTLIKLFGLDAKVRGRLVGCRTYIFALALACLHLGPVLIAVGTALLNVSSALALVLQYVDGKFPLMQAIEQVRQLIAQIGPMFGRVTPDLSWIAAAFGGIYFRAAMERHHAPVQGPSAPPEIPAGQPVPIPAPATEVKQ